jgi:hypothetical protein
MLNENAVEICGYRGRVFVTQEQLERELLDQVTRAIDALNKVTSLSSAQCIWHEPSQFDDVKDYLNRKKMHLERKLSLSPQSSVSRARDQVVATAAQLGISPDGKSAE